MNKSHSSIIVISILVCVLSLVGCRDRAAEEAKPEAAGESAPASITLTAEAAKTAGIETAPAGFMPVVRKIHAPGELMFNPKKVAHMSARTSGRVEQLFAYQGDRVVKGQVLMTFYSKDFLLLQAELLQALAQAKRSSGEPVEKATSQALLDSVRNRLRLLDAADDVIAGIEQSGVIRTLLDVRAPITGNVYEALTDAGDFIEFGVDMFRIADLSTVWADIHIPEKDLARVGPGSEAVIRVGAYPGRELKGRIFQIGNVIDDKTRTVEGRIELANFDGRLKAGMYLEAEILPAADAAVLCVPGGAVLDLQNKKIVFVETAPHTFVLREVELGTAFDGHVEIVKGLKDKETVAVGGSFFLKSELLKKTFGEDRP
jgi:RND family efflux transporter MFP subunit